MRLGAFFSILFASLLAIACDGNGGTDAGVDTGPSDAGCPIPMPLPTATPPATITCPSSADVPDPTDQEGICCHRMTLDPGYHDAPEMRLKYMQIVAPVGSTLSSSTLAGVLNASMQAERFVWLVRVENAAADGPVTITTGFGRRNATDGTYAFSAGMPLPDEPSWCPVQLPGTLSGETITSSAFDGTITVPIFDEMEPPNVQVALVLRQLQIDMSGWNDSDRTCVGWFTGRPYTYIPRGTLSAYIEVATSMAGVIMLGSINTNVCGAIAGSLSDATYCEQPQSAWTTPPDSLCDATNGCRANQPCMTDVCDPRGATGDPGTCNAWHLIAHFAAGAVDITNSTCP